MKWVLVSGKKKIALGNGMTFGRGDYADERRLSRQHFKVEIKNDRVSIIDLGSTNGTFINERRLPLDVAVELRAGQAVRIGETNFVLTEASQLQPATQYYGWALSIVFIFSLVSLIFAPDMDYGRSLSWRGLAILFSMLLLPFAYSAIGGLVLTFKKPALHHRPILFGFAVWASTLAGNYAFVMIAFSQTNLPEYLAQQRIEHYCSTNYNWEKCVLQINICPRCAADLAPELRTQIAETLKAMRPRYPKAEHRQPAAKQ